MATAHAHVGPAPLRAPAGTHRSTRALARIAAAAPLALALTYGGQLWLQLLHHAEGASERNQPAFVEHWIRDASLALPLVLIGVALALMAAEAVVARLRTRPGGVLEAAVAAGLAAMAGCYVFAVGNPIHSALFEARHGGHELPFLWHVLRDGALVLPVMLLLAALVVALGNRLARRRGGSAPQGGGSPWWSGAGRSARLALLFAMALPAFVLSMQTAETATALAGPGAPCPSNAPTKHFEVQAIDVDIPLNRFGDHDPAGKMYVLSEDVGAVRAQEASRRVSIGLRDDAIQPLVVRANLGDCVEIQFTNAATGGDYGVHIDGVAFNADASGDAVGRNPASGAARGASRTYRYYIPEDPRLEGTHYIRPGPGYRDAVAHGLFGALSVEPKGSVYLHPDTRQPLRSGWEAIIKPADKAAFREYVKVYHEVGDENDAVFARDGHKLPTVDPITDAYRPGSRAINYRSEPFMNRLERAENKKSSSYNSYTFGDPATPIMRAYLSDPAKIRIVHAGSEMFHVYHLHGGGIRWPQNPRADAAFDYANVGLNKSPKTGGSNRLDSQSFGPGESYSLEIEGGAGGVQQAVGDLLEHCHIAEHYVAGMWSFWRIFNTRQPDLAELPDREAPPAAVDSAALIGKTMPDGTVLTEDNLDDWVEELIPPRGVPRDDEDGSVWNWTVDRSDPTAPVYLGEPEETEQWPNLPNQVPGHPSALPGDQFVGNRPKIRFNPDDGRPAYPLLRPNIGQRPPLTPNGHTGTPFLGANVSSAPTRTADPWANRKDGLCPQGSYVRRYDLTTIQTPIKVTAKGATDPTGKIFVLNQDKAAVRSGAKAPEPLAIRANMGDCVALTLVTELEPDGPGALMPQSNMHIHHVQFDPQGSDGASAGMVYEQSIRPYKLVDPRLTAAAAAGDTVLELASVAKFQEKVFIGVGLGTEDMEIRQITSIDAANRRVTLDKPLAKDHADGEWAGTEFVQERWYPDVDLDNVFWHDHVDGIHGWGKGMVGQLIVEPKGSTYHDPRTGEEVDSGTIVDIRTSNPLAPGLVTGSFREMALWTLDDNPVTDSTLNLRSEPWADRLAEDPDPSLLFSSWRHGDPNTPLPRAYRGDPFVLRTINVSGNGMDSLHLAGHRFYVESRLVDGDGVAVESTPKDSLQYGISERFTAILEGGAGGSDRRAGDYLYFNGIGRRFRQGAWGLMRVLQGQRSDLQPLPGTSPPAGGALPEPTGGRPPETTTAGNPCPGAAPRRTFDVSAIDLANGREGVQSVYVPTDQAADVRAGRTAAEPLVLHVAAGECLEVKFTNERTPAPGGAGPRASFHVGKLAQTVESSGVNAGYSPEQTVAPGESRTYRYYADSYKIGAATVADFGGNDTGTRGLYGAVVVAPQGATFHDPRTGLPRDVGSQVDTRVPGGKPFRDFTLVLADDDAEIGQNTMPYPEAVDGPSLVNYRSEPRPDDASAFSSRVHGDPQTPILRAYAGDPVRVHVINAPGSEQPHAFSLGGLYWPVDPKVPGANLVSTEALTPWVNVDAKIEGGAGGPNGTVGDMWYGDLRRPFAQAGMWGLMRTLSTDACADLQPLPGHPCGEQPRTEPPPAPRDGGGSGGSGGRERSGDSGRSGPSGGTPSGGSGGSGGSRAHRLRDLMAPRRISLTTLERNGLTFWVTVPADARALDAQLVPTRGRRASTALTRTAVRLRKGGSVRIVWRVRKADAARLKAGRYRLEVRAGTDARHLWPERIERTLELRGPKRS